MPPKLVLIDGHALAYRAFFALPPDLKTRTGELTGAVYGFTSMLLHVWREERPDYLAVTFDVGKTFRNERYAAYKATRAKMPDDLAAQLDRIQQVVQAFNLPVVTAEGFEADDVLGTLARRAAADGLQTLIVTGDTDTFQLINPAVRVLVNQRKWSDTQVYDEAAVRARYGLEPHQLIDYKALVGDPSDNIPGVKGIGEKTAIQLLQQYGALEAIYEHLDEITPKRAQTALAAGRDNAFLSKELATIRTDAPLNIRWEQCRTADYDRRRVQELFRELEFRTLMNRLPPGGQLEGEPHQLGLFSQVQTGAARKPLAAPTAGKPLGQSTSNQQPALTFHLVTDDKALAELVGKLQQASLIAFDVETTSADPMRARLVGLALAVREDEGYYIPVGHQSAEQQLPLNQVIDALKPILADPTIAKIGHNARYDMTVLARYGAPVAGLSFDTMIAEWLIDPASRVLGLKALAWQRLGLAMTTLEELVGSGKNQITMDCVPISEAAPYAVADAVVPLRLRANQTAELRDKNLWRLFEQVEMPLVPVLLDMEMTGVLLDVPFLRQMAVELDKRLTALEKEIMALAGCDFNLNSPQQLAEVLFGKLHLTAPGGRKTATGRVSVAQDVLDSMADQHPIIEKILEHRQLAKLKNTYVDALPALVNPETDRVHTSYNQVGTVTGRLSSSEPNLQNLPIRTELGRQVRRAIIAAAGYVLVAADYSQVELRILAHISGDQGLKAAFARDEDIHASTAAAIYGIPLTEVTPEQRRIAKSINFGLAYGQTAYGLSQAAGISQAEAAKFIAAYFERFGQVRTYIEETKRKAATQGYVETLMGRRRYFPILQSRERDPRAEVARRAAEREAINMPIQGSAADIIKVAMINLHRRLAQASELGARLILQVHDELVVEAPRANAARVIELVRQEMENASRLDVPLKADVKAGDNWEAAK